MPNPSEPEPLTDLLVAWGDGDPEALERLIPRVYGVLKEIASRHVRRERADYTLDTTALVHEAYLKLVDQEHANWHNRAQFCGVAAQLMRRVLIDHARRRGLAARGGLVGDLDNIVLKALAREPSHRSPLSTARQCSRP